MLPEEIVNILSKYQNEVAEEISNINLAIEKISNEINSVSSVLMDELILYAKNTGLKNKDKEIELHEDSFKLREYLSSINIIPHKIDNTIITDNSSEQLDIFDFIVLQNTLKCSYNNHETNDVNAKIPVLHDEEVSLVEISCSYCKTCNRYTILKDDFKQIDGVIMCKVIDETTYYGESITDNLDIEQRKSLLYKYGYNVQSKANISSKERHIILSSIIEANIMNRRQIMDHLTTLIERGSKIQNWKEATNKWKEDKYYVQSYRTENLPSVIFDKIILKYKKH